MILIAAIIFGLMFGLKLPAKIRENRQQRIAMRNATTTTTETTTTTTEVLFSTDDDSLVVTKETTDKNNSLKEGEYSSEKINEGTATYTQITYVVKEGDVLWRICYRFLKDKYAWKKVYKYNDFIDNPHLIYPGDQITLKIRDN